MAQHKWPANTLLLYVSSITTNNTLLYSPNIPTQNSIIHSNVLSQLLVHACISHATYITNITTNTTINNMSLPQWYSTLTTKPE